MVGDTIITIGEIKSPKRGRLSQAAFSFAPSSSASVQGVSCDNIDSAVTETLEPDFFRAASVGPASRHAWRPQAALRTSRKAAG